MPQTHEVHHHQLRKWLIFMMAALVFLLVSALYIQRPQTLTGIPIIGPSATPTPMASDNITVTEPRGDSNVGQEFIVKGTARVFENMVTIRLKEKLSGRVIGELSAYADAPDVGQFGPYAAGIRLTDPNLKSGTDLILEVFQYAAKDGKEIDKVSVPLTFTPVAQ